ncbi:receptor-like protein kinase ANXUR2 [Durio zibethinus]|uniref:non-specific serine/threonine protein kinase n=1 Tax=Durio zibethinus TaxID=66656 RepID=A0A6P5X2P7_DURZI|nr:receptor-like protein kinase ANXUR2 [Durio zibethinus]
MRFYRRFTLEELRTATDNFRLKIGEDGFYSVYKGFIKDSFKDTVAIKWFKDDYCLSKEMAVLSNRHHLNIVSLIGYCLDGSESNKFIIYEYMPRGSLHDQLHRRNDSQPLLSWKKRLEICIGAARGLEFLHTGNPLIIHRDIKTRNILLDQNWFAKISNFEISKLVPTSLSEWDSHVITRVAGTVGYIDPEYLLTGHLTEKSDVYSFGVVLFEVLSARKPREIDIEEGQGRSLVQWCRECVEEGRLDEIIDSRLKDEIAPECLKAYADMAYKCTNERRNERPTIDAVVKRLQLTLLLQECIEADVPFSPSWLRSIVPPTKRTEPLVEIEIQDSELSESDYDFEELLRD